MRGAAGNPPLPLPPIDATEQGALLTYDKNGKERWGAQWTMHRLLVDGQPMVKLTESGEGYYSPFHQRVRWNLESYWWFEHRFSPQRSEKTFTDLKGTLLAVERKTFDWTKGKVRFERVDKVGRRDVDRELKIPADTLTSEGLAVALRSLPFGLPRTVKLHLLSDEPKVYEVTFRIEGVEPVKTTTGLYNCFKVKMDVKLGFLRLFKMLIPEIYFWFSQDPPHFWVRYQGPESGRGSPEVVRLLTH